MRTTLVLVLALLAARPAAAEKRDIRKTQIAEGIFQFTTLADGYVEQLNTVVIVNARDVLVFDTGTRPSDAREILAEIRKLTKKPVRYVVNSHWHPDHWSGNEVYAAAFPDADIIATEETLEYMRHAAAAWPKRFQLNVARAKEAIDEAVRTGQRAGAPYTVEQRRKDEAELRMYRDFTAEAQSVRRTYPTLTYSGKLTLRHGGRELRFLSVVGDARGTTVLHLPEAKVLVTGDVIVHPIPYSTPAPLERIESLKMLRDLDVAVIIPGHGPALRDKAYLTLQIELLEAVVTQVRAALLQGAATLDEVRALVNVDSLRQRFAGGVKELEARFDTHVRDNLVPQVIREAREQDYRQ